MFMKSKFAQLEKAFDRIGVDDKPSRKKKKKDLGNVAPFHEAFEEMRNWLFLTDTEHFNRLLTSYTEDIEEGDDWEEETPNQRKKRLKKEMFSVPYDVVWRYLTDGRENRYKHQKILKKDFQFKIIREGNEEETDTIIKLQNQYFAIPTDGWDKPNNWPKVREVHRTKKTIIVYK